MKRHALFCSALILASLSAEAFSEEASWDLERVTQSMDVKGSANEDYSYESLIARTTDASKPELRFGCSERYGLTATITFLPANDADPRKNSRIKLRQKTTNMTIEGRETERVPWTVVKETRTVQARSSKHAAMIYNAVIQGLSITIKEPYKDDVTIAPPAIDENFTWFAQNCTITQ